MLLASKISTYCRDVGEAALAGKYVSPKSRDLGIERIKAQAALDSLHESKIASGAVSVGRKLIRLGYETDCSYEKTGFGYLYSHSTQFSDGSLISAKAPRGKRTFLVPQLVLHFTGEFSPAVSCEQFSQMFYEISVGFEVTSLPFKNNDYELTDVMCGNGFGHQNLVGVTKSLSRASRTNFSELLSGASFSVSCSNALGSEIKGVAFGARLQYASIESLHQYLVDFYKEQERVGLDPGDYIALPLPCKPLPFVADDEWICVSTGLQIGELRLKFKK